MEQRGRKSTEEQAVPEIPGRWPDPPKSLSAAESAIWRDIVLTKPADWFTRDIHPLLADYCTACVQQDAVRDSLNQCKNPQERTDLLRTLDMLAKLKASLATKMRLTPQSRWQPSVAATKAHTMAATKPPHLA